MGQGSKILEFTKYFSPDGEEYSFNEDEKFLMSETGLGMPPISYIDQRGPFQHGNTIYDYRLEPRIIQLVHRRNACSRDDYWGNRADLINLVRPNRQSAGQFNLGVLRKILSTGDTRDIDVIISQGPAFEPRNLSGWDEWAFTETLRFIAPYPVFYDPTSASATWTSGVTITELDFPITFPIQFSESLLSSSGNNIAYNGTWLSYPTIEVTGPIGGFKITNDTTGEFIHLNYTVPAGDTVTISLEFGNKTVEDVAGNNLIGTVTTDSDLATFHVAPDPEAAGGVNSFSVVGAGVDANTQVVLTYYTYYIGI
jgi:hypothetical protein